MQFKKKDQIARELEIDNEREKKSKKDLEKQLKEMTRSLEETRIFMKNGEAN